MENAENSPPKKQSKNWVKILLWIVGILILVSIIDSAASNNNATPTSAANTATNSTQSAPTPSEPVSSFGDGNYIVGTDIVPGTYKSSGGLGCYWERLRGFGGTTGDIIANDNTDYSAVVTIASTDKGFDSERCGTWTKLSSNTTGASSQTTATTKTTAPTSQPSSAPVATQPQTYTTPNGAVINSSGTVVTPAPAPPASWHTAFTYTDTASASTQPFSLQGTEWRVTYTCTLSDPSMQNTGYFGGYIDSVDNSVTQQFVNSTSCPTQNVSYIYSEPAGQYYLNTNTDNLNYTVTVEDYY